MAQGNNKKHIGSFKNDNLLEALGAVPSKIGSDILTSLLGGTTKSGDLEPNQTIEFGSMPTHEAKPVSTPRLEVQQKPNITELEAQTRQQIEAIRKELLELAKSLKSLHQEVATAISQEPVDPGIYHMNFYEQLRSFLVVLRQQIEDSRSWLATFNTRKKKMGYWGMYKKHGTTFGLSNERSLATAAG